MKIRIPYVEIRSNTSLNIMGIIEGATTMFFESAFHGVGEFEIYCRATAKNRRLLQSDYFVTLPNATDDNIWVINKVSRTYAEDGGRYILASGTEAKSILNMRIVRYTAILNKGNLLGEEVIEKIILPNCIRARVGNTLDLKRQIPNLQARALATNTKTIQETTQVTWENVFDYTEAFYKENECGAKLRFDRKNKKLVYTIYEGSNKPNVVFSKANDNLLSSNYSEDYTNYKTSVIVGGEENEETKVRKVVEIADNLYGFARREVFIDAKDLQSTYEDEDNVKHTLTDAEYTEALRQRGREKLKEEHSLIKEFSGDIDTTNTRYKFARDYYLGDTVTIRDDGVNQKVRVSLFAIVQEQNSYREYFEQEEVIENVE